MSDYITTYTGLHIIPTRPEPGLIRIADIAHALSLTCRGNGHVKTFFSVGQHCIHCALEAKERSCSDRVVLACLLHDAAEAYMSDVPRPFKQHLNDYRDCEERLLALIYTKYLGSVPSAEEAALIKEIDDDMLCYDLSVLLKEPSDGPLPAMKSTFSYKVLPFDDVERRYLELFREYGENLSEDGCL